MVSSSFFSVRPPTSEPLPDGGVTRQNLFQSLQRTVMAYPGGALSKLELAGDLRKRLLRAEITHFQDGLIESQRRRGDVEKGLLFGGFQFPQRTRRRALPAGIRPGVASQREDPALEPSWPL